MDVGTNWSVMNGRLVESIMSQTRREVLKLLQNLQLEVVSLRQENAQLRCENAELGRQNLELRGGGLLEFSTRGCRRAN